MIKKTLWPYVVIAIVSFMRGLKYYKERRLKEVLTPEIAIAFLKGKEQAHKEQAKKIMEENDLISDEKARNNYNAIVDLANIYGEIAAMIKDK